MKEYSFCYVMFYTHKIFFNFQIKIHILDFSFKNVNRYTKIVPIYEVAYDVFHIV